MTTVNVSTESYSEHAAGDDANGEKSGKPEFNWLDERHPLHQAYLRLQGKAPPLNDEAEWREQVAREYAEDKTSGFEYRSIDYDGAGHELRH